MEQSVFTDKVKTTPASLEKLTLSWLKPSKLAPTSLKQDSFLCQLHLFFGLPDEVTRWQTVCNSISFIFLLEKSIKCTTGSHNILLFIGHYKSEIATVHNFVVSNINPV
jgi:hypothetical protein